MTLLLTRPEDDSRALADRLRTLGYGVRIAPMLEVAFHDGPAVRLQGFDGVLATSANGIRALERRTPDREVPVFAVGDATAQAARDLGFARVESASGDVESLCALVLDLFPAAHPKRFLHVAGTAVAGDLAGHLTNAGHRVDRTVLYEAVLRDALPEDTAECLRARTLTGVLIYSPRTARAFRAAVGSGPGAETLSTVRLFALSQAVALAAGDGWSGVSVAATPDTEALVAEIETSGLREPHPGLE